ncbi:MAG: PHP domain-containing protein, partial [Chloroflexi bacterium]|nr:PHP domain-containing protein [Chloroflexota bacterium]
MTASLSNAAVAEILERHGRLLEIAGESPFRTRAFTRAAESLRMFPDHVATVAAEGRLREIPGIGEGISAAIEQILAGGNFDAHRELTSRLPESLVELTALPGVGAKTALRLHVALGVDNLSSLEAALISGKVRETKGLGARAEATIRSGIESLQRRTGRTPLGTAIPLANALTDAYRRVRPDDTISLAGSARRWDVSVDDLDFVVASTDLLASFNAICSLPMVSEAERTGENALRLRLAAGIMADVYLTHPDAWGSTLVRATGNAMHLERLGNVPERAASEEEVYASHDLPFIPPELRAGHDEFERWDEIPSLVTASDINGEFHAHTTWSDGSASIREMAEAAALRGYSLLGITDHSHGLGVAGGLDVERLESQRHEIKAVDGEDGVKLLSGAEVEVHRDGTLDFDNETLASLDVVVASLHTGLRQQTREEVTARLERVLVNPNVDIIAHPSGRLIERREGGDFDWARVFAVAARTGTALEINAD